MKQPFRIDVENFNTQAREHMAAGAVTDSWGADSWGADGDAGLGALNGVLATETAYNLSYRKNALVARRIHAAERVAVTSYSELARWLDADDNTMRCLIEDLLAEEEEHADALSTMLHAMGE